MAKTPFMNFPSINAPDGSPETVPSGNRPQRGWSAWPLILLMLAAVFGPCTAIQVPREVGRWKLVEALQFRAAGENDAAYARLQAASRWFPKSWELRLTKAEWRLADGRRDDALAEAEEMLQVAEGSREMPQILMVHSHFLQSAGEFAKAVDDWEKLVRLSETTGEPSRANALNGLAYAQGLAGIELDDALQNVNESLEAEPGNPAYLDTRAYIYYRQAKSASGEETKELLQKALADMEPAVKAFDAAAARQQSGAGLPLSKPVKKALEARPQTLRDMARTAQSDWVSAVMHYHRALILEELGRKKEAQAERAWARRIIGREPDDTLF
jgi:tetratricopeptide (TPR) repeat protein